MTAVVYNSSEKIYYNVNDLLNLGVKYFTLLNFSVYGKIRTINFFLIPEMYAEHSNLSTYF